MIAFYHVLMMLGGIVVFVVSVSFAMYLMSWGRRRFHDPLMRSPGATLVLWLAMLTIAVPIFAEYFVYRAFW